MSVTPAVAVGTLGVHCPDVLCSEVRPRLCALYPGAYASEFSSDGETILSFWQVPYPVEQTRYTLASLYQWSAQLGGPMYWSWVPPAGVVVLPGGTLTMRCQEGPASVVVRAALQSWFPGAFIYTFVEDEHWVLYDVDTPPLGKDFYGQYVSLVRQGVSPVSFSWYPWFDQVEMPDGLLVSVTHPEV